MSYWREKSIEVIDAVVKDVGTSDLTVLEKAIRKAYPFGARKWWPYKVWLSQVKRTMNQLNRGSYVSTPSDILHYWVSDTVSETGVDDSEKKPKKEYNFPKEAPF